MGSQSKKKTLVLMDQVEFLTQSTITQMPLVSPALTEVYDVIEPIVGDGGEVRVTHWDLVQLTNAGLLTQATRLAFETSQIYRAKKAELSEFHRLRSLEVRGLSNLHSRQRASFLGSYKPELLPLVGLEVSGSKAYTAIRSRCQDSVNRMRNPGLLAQLGDPMPGTPILDFGLMAQSSEDALAKYDALVSRVTEGVKVRDEAFVALQETEDRLRGVYVNVARVQEGLYRLAGFKELADRIRKTIPVRKPNSGEEPAPTP